MSSLTIVDYLVLTNEDWRDGLVITADDDGDVPVDLTGSSFLAHIRDNADRLHVIVTASTDNGKLVVSDPPTDGVLSWNINADEMATITPGDYVYDIVWTTAGGVIDTIIAGKITVKRGVTRP